ncbi:MAG TPA: HNH endonuclease signature motif containing protein [Sphingopyxis sp.]|jgi:hypothetical protein|uniref:HNH endonuclease signature motif containing protein n=1 Tax=Sphingopyxis sp. TaxID=1908224 RepID=UPI002E118ADC|nr:HNH endonuclease signature motif containing protein [Sphingopyxis sp.]
MKGRAISYSADEMAWLEANRTLVISDYHRAFVDAFGRTDVALVNLHSLRKRKGWKVGRAPGRYVGRLRKYTAAEMAWLEENRALPIADYHRRFCEAFDRTDVTAGALHGLRKRHKFRTGRTGQFEQGHVSPNKGRPCPEGVSGRHPNARRTQFKKGQAAPNAHDIGDERVRSDGYVEIMVAERNPYTGAPRRYVFKHRVLWEQANGPLPSGMVLKCLSDNKENCDPANWEAVERGLLPILNGRRTPRRLAFEDAADELKPLVLAQAKLRHQAGKARRRLSA